jgi:hypothetical protein
MVKRVLMVAFHFPPQHGSSGIQRTLKFSQYLPTSGWQPLVLSAHPRAYEATSAAQLPEIAPGTVINRAFALNAGRHFAWRGRYLQALALPDRWWSWLLGAVPAGLSMLRRYRPQVIWSTYPIATAHLIGYALHRLTGLPWIADMRDPMVGVDYPASGSVRSAYLWVERLTIRHSSMVVCTTPGAVATFRTRHPAIPASRFQLIENAYDEENFSAAEARLASAVAAPCGGPLMLLHSGLVYPSERDPSALFEAIAEMLASGGIGPDSVRIVLRATGHDDLIAALIARYAIGAVVSLAPPLPYAEALGEMLSADGLLILQASNCNQQIPAKLYEYLRARRPILGLTDPAGDTAQALLQAGIDTLAPLDAKEAIMHALQDFLAKVRTGNAPLASDAIIASHSRQARTRALALLLDEVSAKSSHN